VNYKCVKYQTGTGPDWCHLDNTHRSVDDATMTDTLDTDVQPRWLDQPITGGWRTAFAIWLAVLAFGGAAVYFATGWLMPPPAMPIYDPPDYGPTTTITIEDEP
jgi:hypothetical protein